MEAKDTVVNRGSEYDAGCGQEICCDILPKYLSGQDIEDCYIAIHRVVSEFVESERKAQAEASFKAGYQLGLREQGTPRADTEVRLANKEYARKFRKAWIEDSKETEAFKAGKQEGIQVVVECIRKYGVGYALSEAQLKIWGIDIL